MKNVKLLLLALCAGAFAQAQWYFETGVNDAKFADFVNFSGTKTTLHSYNGLRDFSHAVGYLFPIKVLDNRVEDDGTPSKIRVGLGLGFDQMNLRAQADFSGSKVPVHYNLSQALAQANVLFTQPIITKKEPDAWGERRVAVNVNAEAGLTYNLYTNAVRTFTTNKGYINDLKNDDDEFVESYPTFFFAGGLSFPIGRSTEIYGKYVVENAFSTDDKNADASKETYSTVKRRVMVGIRLDLRLRNRLKDLQEQRIAALEAREERERDSVDLAPLYARIDALEEELRGHKHENQVVPPPPVPPVVNENTFEVEQHDKGFMYLPDFKHVLFPLNSSYFDHGIYDSQLSDLATFMRENPQLTLKLVGYADSKTGTPASNLELSERRAKRVYDFLLTQGVPQHLMSHIGAGETLQFSIGELTENRRTEIIILER